MKRMLIMATMILSVSSIAQADNTFKLNGQSISGMNGVYYNGQKLHDKNIASYNGQQVSHNDNGIYLNGQKIGQGPNNNIRKKSILSRINPLNLFSSRRK